MNLLGTSTLVISPVIAGPSLSVWVARGSIELDKLAAIAIADVANDLDNKTAPQRHPDSKHAKEALEYAIGSIDGEDETLTRFFPEVILNIRDLSVAKFKDQAGNYIDFNSMDGFIDGPQAITIEIDLNKIDRNLPKPQISTVDGNHRLVKALELKLEDPQQEFPYVSFALLVGLSEQQESILFRDLNGKHKGMDTSHLAAIDFSVEPIRVLLRHTAGQANWLANRLCEKDMPFEGMVRSYAGSKKAYKQQNLPVPVITLQGLKTAVQRTITKSEEIRQTLGSEISGEAELVEIASATATGLALYWQAVKNNFPDAWQDKKNYILLQSIGLNAFSSLGAEIIDRQIGAQKMSQSDFDLVLKHVRDSVDLKKDNPKWDGVAGAKGAETVYKELYRALSSNMGKTSILSAWGARPSGPLDQ